jgi:hypothetical protein
LALEHADRRRWVEEISKINRRLNGEEPEAPAVDFATLKARLGLS